MFSIKRPVLIVALSALAISSGAGTGQGAKKPDYWPFKLGNTWTLDTKVQGKTIKQIITVSKVTKSKSATTATLDYEIEGKVTQTEVYRSDATGLVRLSSGLNGANKINPPIPVIRLPLADGKTWKWSGSVNVSGKSMPGKCTMTTKGPETVATPAGSFKAMRVHLDLTVSSEGNSLSIVNDYWFAANVGMVKQLAIINGVEIVGTLTTYKVK